MGSGEMSMAQHTGYFLPFDGGTIFLPGDGDKLLIETGPRRRFMVPPRSSLVFGRLRHISCSAATRVNIDTC